MSYLQSKQEQVAVTNEPATKMLFDRLANYNEIQSKRLYEIEEKLHNILNRREPQADIAGKEKSLNDFVAGMEENIERVYYSNLRLEKIVQHLNQII